jgi:hypothetical protein
MKEERKMGIKKKGKKNERKNNKWKKERKEGRSRFRCLIPGQRPTDMNCEKKHSFVLSYHLVL